MRLAKPVRQKDRRAATWCRRTKGIRVHLIRTLRSLNSYGNCKNMGNKRRRSNLLLRKPDCLLGRARLNFSPHKRPLVR